jgi:hypothetical protein
VHIAAQTWNSKLTVWENSRQTIQALQERLSLVESVLPHTQRQSPPTQVDDSPERPESTHSSASRATPSAKQSANIPDTEPHTALAPARGLLQAADTNPSQPSITGLNIFGPAEAVLKKLRTTPHAPFSRQTFVAMLSNAGVLAFVNPIFGEIYGIFPIFHQSTVIEWLQRADTDWQSESAARWVALNAMVATCFSFKAANNSFAEVSSYAWGFAKNAFSALPELFLQPPDLLAVQAIVALAVFMAGTTDTRLTSHLVATAVRLAQTLRLHREVTASPELSEVEVEQRQRVFWVLYILDKDFSLNCGLPMALDDSDVDVGLPGEEAVDDHGVVNVNDEQGSTSIFRRRAQLAIIQSQLHRRLYTAKAQKHLRGRDLLETITHLDNALEEWRIALPAPIRPEYHTPASDISTDDMPRTILHLHLVFHNCVGALHWATRRHEAWRTSRSEPVQTMDQARLGLSATKFTCAAQVTIHLIVALPAMPFVNLW